MFEGSDLWRWRRNEEEGDGVVVRVRYLVRIEREREWRGDMGERRGCVAGVAMAGKRMLKRYVPI